MRKSVLILVVIMLTTLGASSQDPLFSQYYQAPLYLNPGFTGITPQQRAVFNYRIQWPNLPQAFSTFAASYDIWVDELKSGFGLLMTTDKMGSAGWRTTTASLLYSFKVKINDKLVFSPGIQFGYGINGLDRTKLRMGDGIEYGNQSLDPDLNKLGNQQYADFSSGFVVYSKTFWIGGAFHHMNQPNLSILNTTTRLPMKVTIHAGARLTLRNGMKSSGKQDYLTPSFIYQSQGGISQMNFGVNYHIDPVFVGFWYRGKPMETNVLGTVQQDAIILQMGMYLDKMTIGYSYDFNTSSLSTASGGAHEISIMYEFAAKPIHRGVKKRNRLIPCPTSGRPENFWK